MKNPQLHSTLLAAAGAYVLFIAWDFYTQLKDGTMTMGRVPAILLTVFFALAGLATIGYAWKVWRDGVKKEKEEKESPPSDDSLKG